MKMEGIDWSTCHREATKTTCHREMEKFKAQLISTINKVINLRWNILSHAWKINSREFYYLVEKTDTEYYIRQHIKA